MRTLPSGAIVPAAIRAILLPADIEVHAFSWCKFLDFYPMCLPHDVTIRKVRHAARRQSRCVFITVISSGKPESLEFRTTGCMHHETVIFQSRLQRFAKVLFNGPRRPRSGRLRLSGGRWATPFRGSGSNGTESAIQQKPKIVPRRLQPQWVESRLSAAAPTACPDGLCGRQIEAVR